MWRNRIAAPMSMDPLSADSRCLFHVDMAETRIDAETGAFVAITEHVGAFTRGANTLTATDVTGATYTAPHAMPAWESRDWPIPGDLYPQPAFGLRMGVHDRLAFPCQIPWQAHRGLYAMIETGARLVSGATLFAITTDDGTGAGLWLASTGSYYAMTMTDGSATITATLTVGQPVDGQRVVFDWRVNADGFLEFAQTIVGSPVRNRAVSSAALTMPTTLGATLAVRINSRTATLNGAGQWFRKLKMVAGNADPSTLAGLR